MKKDRVGEFMLFAAGMVAGGIAGVSGTKGFFETYSPPAAPVTEFLQCPKYEVDRLRDGTIRIRIPPETD